MSETVKRMLFGLISTILVFSTAWGQPKPFEAWENCRYEATDWADGDSFRVVRADGEKFTIRLYGVDCIEWHVRDATDERRLRAQRRYFGITRIKPSARESIEMAKEFGKAGSEMTVRLLSKPFTVHTRLHKALGDGKYERYYGMITCADGTDLGSELVRAGMSRAFGVTVDGPGDRSREEYRDSLKDRELQASKKGAGIWAHTNWDKLPDERREQREEDEALAIAIGRGGLPDDFRLNPNTAARDDLMQLPGVGETTADRIIEAREEQTFQKPDDLLRVSGIGGKTLERIQPFLQFKK